MKNLNGKVAIVTGASRGTDAAIAKRLATEGASVIVNYGGSEARANEVTQSITSDDGKAKAMKANKRDPAAIKRLFDETIETFGRLDILVNNAGTFAPKSLEESTEEDFDGTFDLNVRAVFLAAREAARRMNEGGRIINIGSINGDRMPYAGGGLYGASKAAVAGFTRGWAERPKPEPPTNAPWASRSRNRSNGFSSAGRASCRNETAGADLVGELWRALRSSVLLPKERPLPRLQPPAASQCRDYGQGAERK